MADAAVTEAAPPANSTPAAKKSKSASAASKKQRVKPTPPEAYMVIAAINSLKEHGGSSLHAFKTIKKYITANYKIDAGISISPFIKKYLKRAVTGRKLIQTKGKGASGSFKLSATGKTKSEAAPKKAAPRNNKAKAATGVKKPKAKEAASPVKKKPAAKSAEKKKKAAAPAKAAKKAGSAKAP